MRHVDPRPTQIGIPVSYGDDERTPPAIPKRITERRYYDVSDVHKLLLVELEIRLRKVRLDKVELSPKMIKAIIHELDYERPIEPGELEDLDRPYSIFRKYLVQTWDYGRAAAERKVR